MLVEQRNERELIDALRLRLIRKARLDVYVGDEALASFDEPVGIERTIFKAVAAITVTIAARVVCENRLALLLRQLLGLIEGLLPK